MPGLLLCFVLRYDAHRKTQASSVEVGLPPPATYYNRITYFHCSLIGYFLGACLPVLLCCSRLGALLKLEFTGFRT